MGGNSELILAGIDSGARATKVVLLDARGGVVSSADVATGSSPREAARKALSEAASRAGVGLCAITFITATGYGRSSIDASLRLTEITCHARGARHGLADVRTVIDVGGQDSKFIALASSGDVEDFVMNDRCAAGTGRFLEVAGSILGVGVGDLSALAAASASPAPIASVCVVFTESEMVSLIGQGRPAEDIAAGVVRAMAARIRGGAGHIAPREPAAFVGGVARNAAFAEALAEALGIRLFIPREPHLNGALGAALFSLEKRGSVGYTRA